MDWPGRARTGSVLTRSTTRHHCRHWTTGANQTEQEKVKRRGKRQQKLRQLLSFLFHLRLAPRLHSSTIQTRRTRWEVVGFRLYVGAKHGLHMYIVVSCPMSNASLTGSSMADVPAGRLWQWQGRAKAASLLFAAFSSKSTQRHCNCHGC